MLLQTNTYIVPSDKRSAHLRLMRRFRQAMARLGCEHFEVFELTGSNWRSAKGDARFVQMMRFRDRKHHAAVQAAERQDPGAQELIREFCQLLDLEYQRDHSLFSTGYYAGVVPPAEQEAIEPPADVDQSPAAADESRAFTTADADLAALERAAAELTQRQANKDKPSEGTTGQV